MDSHYGPDDLFASPITFPDSSPRDRLSRLVGLDAHKNRLAKILGILINPDSLSDWADKHQPGAERILVHVLRRPPLVVLAGDVGSGKTELAETIGDDVARKENIDITLFPLSLATRGHGRVGEMTQLLSSAFDHTVKEASRLKADTGKMRGAVILLIDEADALAQSRETAQMHHEDRAGVNALIRGIDGITQRQVPAAVIMCTNRLNALDPAVTRRAADILTFHRPNDQLRNEVLGDALGPLGFTVPQLQPLVELTGAVDGRDYGFTFSDLVQRLLPAIVLDAYPHRPVSPKRAVEIARTMNPTPPFQDGVA